MANNLFGKHLHNQIVYPLLASLVMVGVIAVVVAVSMIGQVIERWIDANAESTIVNVESRLNESSDDIERALKLVAEDRRFEQAVNAGDVQTISAMLVGMNQSLETDNVMLLDDSGAVIASTGRLGLRVGDHPLGAGDRDWVTISMSHPILAGVGKFYTLTALHPVKGPNDGAYTLAVSRVIDDSFVAQISQGADAGVCILDAVKRPVAVAISGNAGSTELADALRESDEVVLSALDERGIEKTWPLRVGGSQYRVKAKQIRFGNDPTRSTAYLAVALPTTVADDARRTTTTLITVWSIVAVVFLVGLNWYIARRVSEPLGRLSESVSKVADGDFSAKVSFSGANEITQLADDFNVMTDSLRERTESLTKKVLELATLYEMSRSLGSTLDLDMLLESVLDSAMRIFDVELGYVTLRNHETGALEVRSYHGAGMGRTDDAAMRASMAEWVIKESRPLIFNPPHDEAGSTGRVDPVSGALAALCVPLVSAEGTIGAITVGSTNASTRFTSDDVRLLATIANHVTIAVGNIDLFSSLQEAYLATVRALAAAVDAKDPYTRGHSDKVAQYALIIGQRLDLSPEQLTALEMAAYLHDIGKIGVAEEILLKPGKLSDEEMGQMRHHPLIGANILKPIAFPWPIAPVVRHHHEHYDGAGYPAGLKAEEIPLLARVLTVADAFEAMIADRPYRRGRSIEEAILELRRCSGTQFDPRVVDAFIRALEECPEALQPAEASPASDLGPEETRAVFVALCDGMFASFRKLGGPRLAANLEQEINARFAADGLPYSLSAGHLVADDDGRDVRVDDLRAAMKAICAFIEQTSGVSLVAQFYSEALEILPERMRKSAEALGLGPLES
ncbi:MAG: HD domain-containing protein [Actinomycetia bacterium]|nr:HD domain-containing protein [Actinomycetes bacterium]